MIVTEHDAKMQMQENEIVLYQPNDAIHLEVRLEEDTVWLNRNQMAILFGRDVKTIGKHIKNALREELKGVATVANFAIVQNEGGRSVVRVVEFTMFVWICNPNVLNISICNAEQAFCLS